MFLPCVLPVSSPWFSATRVWVWGLQNKRGKNKKSDTVPLTLRCLSLGPAQVEQLLVALPRDSVWGSASPPPSVFGIMVHLPTPFLSTGMQKILSPLHEKGVVDNQLFFPLLSFPPTSIMLLAVLVCSEHPGDFTAPRAGLYQVTGIWIRPDQVS